MSGRLSALLCLGLVARRMRRRPWQPARTVASVRASRSRVEGGQLSRLPRGHHERRGAKPNALSRYRRLREVSHQAARHANLQRVPRRRLHPRRCRNGAQAPAVRARTPYACNAGRLHSLPCRCRPRESRDTRPKMATCFGCHQHENQWAVRDCDGCHVDLQAENTLPSSHMVHEGDWLREHGVRAAALAISARRATASDRAPLVMGSMSRLFLLVWRSTKRTCRGFIELDSDRGTPRRRGRRPGSASLVTPSDRATTATPLPVSHQERLSEAHTRRAGLRRIAGAGSTESQARMILSRAPRATAARENSSASAATAWGDRAATRTAPVSRARRTKARDLPCRLCHGGL